MEEGYDVQFGNLLEIHLSELASKANSHNFFPPCGINRFDLYKKIKAQMNDKYYRDVDGGLTEDSGGGAFTRHDLGHVNDVIRRAGQLLGAGSTATSPALKELSPYEVFVLLVACLIHDAGNVGGRMGHEARAREALRAVSEDALGQKEISLISKIAKAHGGKAQDGSKDTIRDLRVEDGVEDCKIRPRLLAAVLRYADELAENSRRANTRKVLASEFPNLFCRCISVRVDYESRRVGLDFTLSNEACSLFGKSEAGEEMFFADYIRKRVEKSELERRYCDQYMRNIATFEETRVLIEFLHDDHEWRQHVDFILRENGYPTAGGEVVSKDMLDGSEIASSYTSFKSSKEADNG